MNDLLYKIVAPVLRRLLGESEGRKPLDGTSAVLHYPRGQHLGFLFRKVVSYEPQVRSQIAPYIRKGDLVFEIGSNIGQYTLWLSEVVGARGRVVAVEPDPRNIEWLQKNIRENRCNNVVIHQIAIAGKAGELMLYQDGSTGGRSSSLFRLEVANRYRGESVHVRVETMEHLYGAEGVPRFVKVDVEGAELMVFSNREWISRESVYMVEFRKETGKQLGELFSSMGFSAFLIDEEMKEWKVGEGLPVFGNFLFVPSLST